MAQERKDIITDEALMAPLIMADNLEVEYQWLLKVAEAGRKTGEAVDQSESAKKVRDEIAKLAQEQSKLIKVQGDIAESSKKTTTATKAEVESLNKNRQAYGQLRTEEERTSKVGKDLLKTIQDQEKQLGGAGKNTQIYTGSLAKLKNELKAAKDEMAFIAETLGEDSKEFREAALKAGELSDKLGDIQEAAKVVSGGTAFEKLGDQTALLQSNIKNLDFKGATNQLKGLTATVKGLTFKEASSGIGSFTKGVGGLGKAILGHPLFLLIAVIVLIVTAVVQLKDKIIPLTKAFEAGAAVVEWFVQQLKDFSDWLGISAFAAEDHAKRVTEAAEKQRKKLEQRYNDEIKLAEAAGERTEALERSKQRAIIGTSEKAIKAMDAQVKAGQKLSEEQQKQYDDLKQAVHDAEIEIAASLRREGQEFKKLREDAKKEIEKQKEDHFSLNRFRIQQNIKAQEDIKNTEGKSLEQRIAASVKAEQLKEKLIRKERDFAISKLYGDIYAEKLIREKAAADIAQVQKDAAAEQRKLLIDAMNEEAEELDTIVAEDRNNWEVRVNAAQQAMERRVMAVDLALDAELISQEEHDKMVLELQQETTDKLVQLTLERQQKIMKAQTAEDTTQTNNELIDLENQLAEGTITYKDYLEQRREIQEDYQDRALQSQLNFLKEQADILKKSGIDTTNIQKEISDLELEIAREKNEKLVEGEEEIQEKLQELRTAGVEGILEIIDNFNAAADEKRQEESEKIQEKLESDLELVGTNEAAKQELRNKAEVEQAKLRKEQAAADRKRAVFEKATAALSIGVNTAKGIGMALGTYPPPVSFILAALVGVLGAIQLGVVLSKPIPTYAKGTRGHIGGPAVVGEKGSELIITPSGKEFMSSNSAQLIDLEKGSQVLTHEETMKELAKRAVARVDSTRGTKQDIEGNRKLEQKLDNINHTLRTRPVLQMNFSKQGAEAVFRHAENRIKFLNDFYA